MARNYLGNISSIVIGTAMALAVGAAAANAATVSLPEGPLLAIPSPNQRTVAINVDDASNIEAALIRVQYNLSVAIATGVSLTPMTQDCFMESNLSSPTNEVQISLACTTPLTGSGPMFTIDFAGANPGLTNLTFLECQLNEGSPGCQVDHGNLRVSACGLDVDASGGLPNHNTDGTYIFRGIQGLETTVPAFFRSLLPGIPEDDVIQANIDAIWTMLDVDGRGGIDENTDGTYIFRAIQGLETIVPAFFRTLDPTIPSDQAILSNIQAICPSVQ